MKIQIGCNTIDDVIAALVTFEKGRLVFVLHEDKYYVESHPEFNRVWTSCIAAGSPENCLKEIQNDTNNKRNV